LVLRAFLVLRRWSYVEVGHHHVKVRMAYGFAVRFERSNVAHVSRAKPVPVTTGAHGWRGRWTVNGASRPMVAITLREPVRGRALFFPVRVREVLVSTSHPDALIGALS
jgi:hypothetical protein